jgi:hypothetical protein
MWSHFLNSHFDFSPFSFVLFASFVVHFPFLFAFFAPLRETISVLEAQ